MSGARVLVLHTVSMDLKLFLSTFLAIFVAEMGDKTQLATLAMAGGASSRWVVFAAAALALVATSAIAVLAGGVVNRYVSPLWIKRAAGAIFLVLGVLYLLSTPDAPSGAASNAEDTTDASPTASRTSDGAAE